MDYIFHVPRETFLTYRAQGRFLPHPALPKPCSNPQAQHRIPKVITSPRLSELLGPFGIVLSADQEDQLRTYLELLTRWSARISLTSIRDPERCITRHFGESFYLVRCIDLRGRLLDVGSGAGFPGLALKIIQPDLSVTLLEPVTKKRAFLKEVGRECRMASVEVLGDRIEAFSRRLAVPRFDLVTARAVGRLDSLVDHACRCLADDGQICLWLGQEEMERLQNSRGDIQWRVPIPMPLSRNRTILTGIPKAKTNGQTPE